MAFDGGIDLKSAQASFKDEIYSSACFHSQQTVEKSLKALLLHFEAEIVKTHDLLLLLSRAVKYEKELKKFKKTAAFLNKFYIPTRYPDAFPGSLPEGLPKKKEAVQAFKRAKEIFEFITKKLL
ncbi:MAG TPA: HEPN domain-containing protein [Nevskiaceae bacterium]|nr:HEPN domain-containing protein [Nevskiaceae bacterium]